jgi:hypothetical protein
MRRLRVVVLGYIIRGPLGGLAWHHLQYVLGLARLGHDVYFAEDSDDYPSCYDPTRDTIGTDPAYGLAFATRTFERVGLGQRWAYYDAPTGRWLGPCASRILSGGADLLLNLSGINPLRPWWLEVPARALVDTDPVFTQVRHLTRPEARALAQGHTTFFSFGANLGRPGTAVPSDGFPWQATRQPVVLDAWPVTPGPPEAKFTTIMQWDSYPAAEYAGRRYGLKSDSFAPYLDLPEKAGHLFELALGAATAATRATLHARGWEVCSSLDRTRDPWTYQRYLQQSRAEFSVAKHGYAMTRCGWFSERSAAYLASGRPVLVQDTGFSDWLPAGEGILAFNTLEEALAGVAEIMGRYDFHCRAARAIAEEYFDARRVLSQLIKGALAPPRPVGAIPHPEGRP